MGGRTPSSMVECFHPERSHSSGPEAARTRGRSQVGVWVRNPGILSESLDHSQQAPWAFCPLISSP